MAASRLCRSVATAFLLVMVSALPLGAVGQPAPGFTITTVDGETVGVPAAGEEPLVVYFMAAWCSSCAIPAGELAQIRKDYGPRAPTILALDVDPSDTAADLRAFARGIKDADYHWAMDQGGAMVRVFGVTALDTTVILAPGGRVAVRRDGPIRYAALQRELDKLLP